MLGFVIGLVLPILGLVIMKFLWYRHDTFNEFYHTLIYSHSVLTKVLTLSLLLNLVPFIYANSKRLDYLMRGVVIATVLYALVIVLLMYVW